jgi:hypothetical protein
LKSLTPDELESLCGKIIGLLGVRNPVVTRASADEGMDFYGKLELGGLFYSSDLSPTVQKQMNIWLGRRNTIKRFSQVRRNCVI